MANLREESLNSFLALRLDQYDGIHVAPQRHGAGAAMNITVIDPRAADSTPILVEAEIGEAASKLQASAKEASQQRRSEPSALAFAFRFPRQPRN